MVALVTVNWPVNHLVTSSTFHLNECPSVLERKEIASASQWSFIRDSPHICA